MVLDIIFLKYTHSSIMYVNLAMVGPTLNKFQFVVHFKSAVAFFHGNGNELFGVKGPPNNSKSII